ncbi:hypothetical protein IAT38_000632 [Cryptococcus sp. DSM 104549]
MSLLAPRPNEGERASVLLPTVTCSSCSAPIPLSSLGDHVCHTPAVPRAIPRPPQITIPQNRPPQMARRPSHHQEPSPSQVRPPFAGPSSAHPSPSSSDFAIPRRPSPNNLTPPDRSPNNFHSGFSTQIRTPSPTNPFFPNSANSYGSNGMQEQLPMIDTTSGGESGMAGVGRRAFAAAAWGVRAGVALAAQARQHAEASASASPQYATSPHPAPWQQSKTSPTPREPVIMPSQPLSVRQRPELVHSRTDPIPRQSPPSRSRTPASPPQRSQSAMSQRSAPTGHARRQESISSDSSSRVGDSLAELLKGRAGVGAAPEKANSTGKFFEKVKEMNRSNSILSRTNTMSTSSVGAGRAVGMARTGSGETADRDRLVASPSGTTFDLDDDFDDDEQHSALPWATGGLEESPRLSIVTKPADPVRSHHRYPTAGSEASTSSSASSNKSGRWGGGGASGPESEEVVTPSQSWEGLADRANGGGVGRDILQQIGEEEEEEEERVVFGSSAEKKKGGEGAMSASNSASTITSRYPPTIASYPTPTKARHADPPTQTHRSKPSHSHSHSQSQSNYSHSRSGSVSERAPERERERQRAPQRKPKICQKCGETVGGAKRFVERDGVVLCEMDWKKLYLPACRRCNLPIEKSAVSSSDGQLKGKWHRACFTCTRCDKPFAGDSFYVHGGKPWCQFHYHEENGTLCASSSCRQPIEGPCILTPGADSTTQRFHPGHLRCDHRGGVSGASSCREAMDEYYDVGGKRFCERHVREAMRKGSAAGGSQGTIKAEKRRTRLVELPVGGLGL